MGEQIIEVRGVLFQGAGRRGTGDAVRHDGDGTSSCSVPPLLTKYRYGENATFEGSLWGALLPYVLAVRPSRGSWGPEEAAHTPQEAAQEVPWTSPEEPGGWTAVERRFRDGHTETWWAADLQLAGYGPSGHTRLVAATTDPATLPAVSTWYLVTNLPHP